MFSTTNMTALMPSPTQTTPRIVSVALPVFVGVMVIVLTALAAHPGVTPLYSSASQRLERLYKHVFGDVDNSRLPRSPIAPVSSRESSYDARKLAGLRYRCSGAKPVLFQIQ